jgi:hypothetical protein
MLITVCGPNLRDQSKGQFHVHAADCADLVKHARREPEYRHGWTVDVPSVMEAVVELYADMLDERYPEDEWGDHWQEYNDLYFFPCCKSLPEE